MVQHRSLLLAIITLRHVSPIEARAQWPWIREGLLATFKKLEQKYLPEDVYADIRGHTSHLYLINETEGFIVFQQHADHDGPVLFIWALWAKPWTLDALRAEIYGEIEKLARHLNAKRIRMQSPRRAWERESFFTPGSTIYERELV